MTSNHLLCTLVSLALLTTTACGGDNIECFSNQTQRCDCLGGMAGVQTCDAIGGWSRCECQQPSRAQTPGSDGGATPQSSPRSRVLPVPAARQMTQNWCWAAASQMVLASRGVPVDQCAILSKWYGVNCCGNFSACDVPGSNEQIRNTMLFEGNLSSSVINRPLSWQEAVAEIDQGRPFIIGYRSSFIGHVVVAFGYNEATRTLSLHDPMYGTFEVPYGSTFSYAQQAFWGFTIGNFGSRPSPTNKCCTQAGTFISQAPGEAGTACAAPNPLTSGPIPGLWCY